MAVVGFEGGTWSGRTAAHARAHALAASLMGILGAVHAGAAMWQRSWSWMSTSARISR
jgi:hypothetical protein